ncbi:matrix metalloproteinase-25-like [Anticarsia gemmatalis]|uniref:matrix metalloproteinase-25-like n=1 Tax=Anticarsia gemmatalis TaxID=129554 RepID=UPI003F770380
MNKNKDLPAKGVNQITTMLTIWSQRSGEYETQLSAIFPSAAMRFTCVLCLLTFCFSLVRCKPAVQVDDIFVDLAPATPEELTFMKKYGYLPELDEQGDEDFAYTRQSISEALKKVQAFAGLPETGIFDPETKRLFKRRRCGVKDIETQSSARSRRYVIQQGWNKKTISYRVVNGSNTLAKSRVEYLMAKGLALWAPYGGLRFHKVDEGRGDIRVSFVSGAHGDGFPFDGPGRVVAHAFPPSHGAMHFDEDEIWGDNPDEDDKDVTNFFAVAVHEIGHALGMSHSNVNTSVMYPYYQVPIERLDTDDILGMKALYLTKEEADTVTETDVEYSQAPSFTKSDLDEEEENYIPDLCMTNYDTLQVLHDKIYVFEEEWVWVLRERNQIEEGYPKRFHDVFIGLPGDMSIIKTIYQKENGNVVIFRERDYWEFNPSYQILKQGSISEYLIPDEVAELTTVFLSNYNNKTYLIEEERYWRFDERTGTMDPGYPKDMSMWRQVPYPVDAAIIWKEDTFFFQGPRFWRFDNTLIQAHKYYPLPTAQIWFGCEYTPDMDRFSTNDGP